MLNIVYGCSLIRHYAACASNDTFPITYEKSRFFILIRGRARGAEATKRIFPSSRSVSAEMSKTVHAKSQIKLHKINL